MVEIPPEVERGEGEDEDAGVYIKLVEGCDTDVLTSVPLPC